MKKFVIILGMVLMASQVYPQAPLSRGENQLNFGIGVNDRGIPLYVGLDFAFHDDWTAGPVVRIISDDDDLLLGALARVDYHWNRLLRISSDWDLYLGANLGLLSGDDVEFDLGLQLGGRWYWNERWALNLEFGGGTGYGTSLGLSVKL